MESQLLIYLILLVIGWLVVVAPARVLLPFLISKQLAFKDPRLASLLNRIPFYKFDAKANAIEKLLKKPQNIMYMSINYPITFKWYNSSHKVLWRVTIILVVIMVVAQVTGVVRFAIDPKSELNKMQKAAESWRKSE